MKSFLWPSVRSSISSRARKRSLRSLSDSPNRRIGWSFCLRRRMASALEMLKASGLLLSASSSVLSISPFVSRVLLVASSAAATCSDRYVAAPPSISLQLWGVQQQLQRTFFAPSNSFLSRCSCFNRFASAFAFASSSLRIRSMSPLRMYFLAGGAAASLSAAPLLNAGPSSAFRLLAISALRKSIVGYGLSRESSSACLQTESRTEKYKVQKPEPKVQQRRCPTPKAPRPTSYRPLDSVRLPWHFAPIWELERRGGVRSEAADMAFFALSDVLQMPGATALLHRATQAEADLRWLPPPTLPIVAIQIPKHQRTLASLALCVKTALTIMPSPANKALRSSSRLDRSVRQHRN